MTGPSTPPTVPQNPARVRLADCLRLMQAGLIHVNPNPRNLGRVVSGVLLHDPLDGWMSAQDQIVLAVGLAHGSPAFARLIARAEEDDAAAVVLKAHGTALAEITAAAPSGRLAVLLAADGDDWTRLAALARAAVLGSAADSVSGVRLGDLYALANTIASLTNGAASIVDPVGRILGYSTLPGQPTDELRRATTLALQEIEHPAVDTDFATVYASPSALLVPSRDESFDRLAVTVRAGGELLGTIWVIDPGPAAQPAALRMLDRLAPLAGLHLLHARSASDYNERRTGDLVRTIMNDPGHASFAAAQLGLEASTGYAVAAFGFARPDPTSLDGIRELQRLLHLVTTTCGIHFANGHCALIESVVYAVLPATGAAPRSAQRRVAQDVATYSQSISSSPVVAAIGAIAPRIGELHGSKAEAGDLLDYLLKRRARSGSSAPSIGLVEDYQAEMNLRSVGSFLQAHGHDGSDLAPLLAYDAEHQTGYVSTLRAYLEFNASITAVAERLRVHKNTVRYRIARITDEFGLDLDDPQKRLWLWLRLATTDPDGGSAA